MMIPSTSPATFTISLQGRMYTQEQIRRHKYILYGGCGCKETLEVVYAKKRSKQVKLNSVRIGMHVTSPEMLTYVCADAAKGQIMMATITYVYAGAMSMPKRTCVGGFMWETTSTVVYDKISRLKTKETMCIFWFTGQFRLFWRIFRRPRGFSTNALCWVGAVYGSVDMKKLDSSNRFVGFVNGNIPRRTESFEEYYPHIYSYRDCENI